MRLRLASFFLLVLTAWILTASARSGGGEVNGWADSVKNNDGCTCHGAANSATVISLANWPSSYVPGQAYLLEVTSTTDLPNPAVDKNQGGFLAWTDKGELQTTPGTQSWTKAGTYSSGGSWIAHNAEGDRANGQQKWNITWTAPPVGAGSVTMKVYVNRVNGNNAPDSGDHWNKKTFTATEGSATSTSVAPTSSHTQSSSPASTTPATTTSSLPMVPVSRDQGGQNEPAPGFVVATLVVLVAVMAARTIRRP